VINTVSSQRARQSKIQVIEQMYAEETRECEVSLLLNLFLDYCPLFCGHDVGAVCVCSFGESPAAFVRCD